jgi:hypothetical protein
MLAAPAFSAVGSRSYANPAIVEHLYSLRRVLVAEDNLIGWR